MTTTTGAFFAVFFVGVALLEWVVIKQSGLGYAPVWGPWFERLGYLLPISIVTALIHGALVEFIGWIRRQRGKTAIRRLTMPITAGIAGVVLMAFPSIPGHFTNLSHTAFGDGSILEYLLLPMGIALLCTAIAFVLGASGGGLRGRQ
jgi:H+/Cl- antiporter ClcA